LSKLYAQAKVADQRGDIPLAKTLLTQLVEEDPDDARLYRRLARLEKDQGNVAAATSVLQQGLRRLPKNAWLWHGLGQIAPNDRNRKQCYHRAIQLEPTFAFPYHALGTLEHTQGRIASAMKILKTGVYHCPTNHRLHHALGDLYRDAKMLEMAERSYKKALQHGPAVSHGFCYTALAYVAYEQGNVDKCRSWLLKAIALNNGRHANGWLSLAQLEESEGNTEGARSVCIAGATMYERSLIERHSRNPSGSVSGTVDVIPGSSVTRQAMATVPTYRSGDRFYNLYRNWARLEERQGTRESAEEVYRRATAAFPGEWRLFVDWAQYYVKLHSHEAARATFAEACARVGRRNAKPYRLYAAFEMGLGDYKAARKILFQGATALAQRDDGFVGNRFGLAELYYAWAVCEWHLNDINRAETLFDHALRLTSSEEEGEFRSVTMYALARLYHYRGEHLLAQHCIGLCLVENAMPGGNAKIWELWFQVATSLGNRILAEKCQEQAERASSPDDSNELAGLSRLLAARSAIGSAAGASRATSVEVERHMRRDPWHHKIFGSDLQHHETGSSDLGITLPAM
jgi:tetratricopeptide (TPR) repeat protein